MDLKQFISTSLQQIAEGIHDADTALRATTNAVVNPIDLMVHSDQSQAYGRTRGTALSHSKTDSRIVEKVHFDIAITIQEGSEAGGGVRVSVLNMGIGANAKTDSRSGSETRIKFAIPMVFPSKVQS